MVNLNYWGACALDHKLAAG